MLSFYNMKTDSLQSNIWAELQNGLLSDFSVENFLWNNRLASSAIEKSKPLFKDMQQLTAGTYWDGEERCVKQQLYAPKSTKGLLSNLIETTARLIEGLGCHRIGVHLSGGFDSTLIMALLKELHIPFVPIGLKSTTFEFRTEAHIQEIVVEWGQNGKLIDIEEYPHFSGLDCIPAHQIPDADIKSVSAANAMAESFMEQGCDIVFSGLGGDSLFVDNMVNPESARFNIGNEFINPTEDDRVYAPRGIKLVSFFAQPEIIDVICSARKGQREDPLKWWARSWAQSLLPKELTEKSFYADFFGLSMWGLEQAKPTIRKLMEETYEISRLPAFSLQAIAEFLSQDVYSFEYEDYIDFCGLISVATWYHSLYNNA